MSVYLETNALRKLVDYSCDEPVCTSIFAIFELLSGITKEDFEIRKACLKRISETRIEVRGPMIDKLFMELVEETDYNQFACDMIEDIFKAVICANDFSQIVNLQLLITNNDGKSERINALEWLKNWDRNIANITRNIQVLFEDDDRQFIVQLYNKDGIKGLADYYWERFFSNRIDENRMLHAEAFIGSENIEKIRRDQDILFDSYNFKLFLTAQAAVFSKAYFINGNTQNANNASDLLHLLYLNKGDKYVSNDKIYQQIAEACPEFRLVTINNEKRLADLIHS